MPKPLAGPELTTTPAIGTWMGVPIGAAMSRPWWTVPQRPPKPEVTGPDRIRTPPPAAAGAAAGRGAAGAATRGAAGAGAATRGAAAAGAATPGIPIAGATAGAAAATA